MAALEAKLAAGKRQRPGGCGGAPRLRAACGAPLLRATAGLLRPHRATPPPRSPPSPSPGLSVSGGSSGSGGASANDLRELRALLVAAKEEQEALRAERDAVSFCNASRCLKRQRKDAGNSTAFVLSRRIAGTPVCLNPALLRLTRNAIQPPRRSRRRQRLRRRRPRQSTARCTWRARCAKQTPPPQASGDAQP